jgi:hypothetical protein
LDLNLLVLSAPAPAADCTDALLSLAGCLSYVQEGSNNRPDVLLGAKEVVHKALQLPAAVQKEKYPVL